MAKIADRALAPVVLHPLQNGSLTLEGSISFDWFTSKSEALFTSQLVNNAFKIASQSRVATNESLTRKFKK